MSLIMVFIEKNKIKHLLLCKLGNEIIFMPIKIFLHFPNYIKKDVI